MNIAPPTAKKGTSGDGASFDATADSPADARGPRAERSHRCDVGAGDAPLREDDLTPTWAMFEIMTDGRTRLRTRSATDWRKRIGGLSRTGVGVAVGVPRP